MLNFIQEVSMLEQNSSSSRLRMLGVQMILSRILRCTSRKSWFNLSRSRRSIWILKSSICGVASQTFLWVPFWKAYSEEFESERFKSGLKTDVTSNVRFVSHFNQLFETTSRRSFRIHIPRWICDKRNRIKLDLNFLISMTNMIESRTDAIWIN